MTRTPRILLTEKRVIQIAGINDEDEARMLVDCGVDFLGFPLGIVHRTGDAGEKAAAKIIGDTRPPAFGVPITYLGLCDEVLSLCRRVKAYAVQLHGGVALEEMRRLREMSPDILIVKTLVVRGGDLARLEGEIDRFTPYVDAFLADTFDGASGRWGATGKTHDWSISRGVVLHSTRPVILAGGLNPSNVARAILEVGPAGVDVHTGVEDNRGRKDRRLVERFVEEARKAFDRA